MTTATDIVRPLTGYFGQKSFFGGEAPLDEWIGYLVVLGFGALFSVLTSAIVMIGKVYGTSAGMTSEHFK